MCVCGVHVLTATLTSGLKCGFPPLLFPVSAVYGQKGVMILEFSVDMIRISTKVSLLEFSSFYCAVALNPEVSPYIGKGMSEYHYNFSVAENLHGFVPGILSDTYNRFYFAYQHNSEKGNSDYGKFSFVLEYNPNKCVVGYGVLNYILRNFFNDVDKIQLRSCDLCCDFPDILIDNFVYDKNRKRYTCNMTGNNGRTIYLGRRGSNGSVKIYDKAAELGLSGKVLTRYEVTLSFDDTYFSRMLFSDFHVDVNLPAVFVNTGQLALMQDAKLRAAVLCIQNGFMSMNDFGKDFRKKIRSYLADSSSFVIDDTAKDLISITIVNYIKELSSEFTDYEVVRGKNK